jgi:hypothetical protein
MPLRDVVRAVLIVLLTAAAASAGTSPVAPPERQRLDAIHRMMRSLAYDSARAAITIRDSYDDHLELLYLKEYEAMEGALATGGLVPLPYGVRFNVRPRLAGPHPIGEKDLSNQGSYLAARPFTMGCLLAIASRVKSGPIEITSLVRHGEYQDALLRTNGNARTGVPTHTMGLAFDIALINSSIETVTEIRDVLLDMRDAGDLLFIGERNQLVFHVVPHPARLGHFMDLYNETMNAAALDAAQMVSLKTPAAPSTPPLRWPSADWLLGAVLVGALGPAVGVALTHGRARSVQGGPSRPACCTTLAHETCAPRGDMLHRALDGPRLSSIRA